MQDKWLEIWAFSRYNLGLSEDEFWELSLPQFLALKDRYFMHMEELDWRAAQICAVIANTSRSSGRKSFQAGDFMRKHYAYSSFRDRDKTETTILNMFKKNIAQLDKWQAVTK